MTAATCLRALACASVLGWPAVAAAEHISTYWRLEPVDPEPPASARLMQPFFTERLVPIGLVSLTESATVGGQTLPAGALLFKVFNDDGKIAYCQPRVRKLPDALGFLRVPIADRQVCFVDSDKDGRFDKSFSVFDLGKGLPNVRGSIDGADPMATTVGYRKADPHEFHDDLTVSLKFWGTAKPDKVRLNLKFSRNVDTRYDDARRTGPTTFQVMNAQVDVVGFEDRTAQIQVRWSQDICVTSDWFGDIIWAPLPAAALGD